MSVKNIIKIILSKQEVEPSIRKIIVISDNCIHCEEYVKSNIFRELVSKSSNRIAIISDPIPFCADCTTNSITKRDISVELPSIIDLQTHEIYTAPRNTSGLIKELTSMGIYSLPKKEPEKKSRRKTDNIDETDESSKKKTRKRLKKEEFYRRKEEEKMIKAAIECSNNVCIE